MLLVLVAGLPACGGEPAQEPADRELPALGARPASRTCLAGLPDPPPKRLSETRCFRSLSPLEPAPDLVPYEVISPLWTDTASKHRYLALPPGESIGFTRDGAWELPAGTVIVKVFALQLAGDPEAAERAVEVRFMIRRQRGWEYHSYEIDESGTDGALLDDGKLVDHAVATATGTRDIQYAYPSREACTFCHGDGVGEALGPRTVQTNLRVRYGDEVRNQLEALSDIGMFDVPVTDPSALPSMPDPSDESAPIADRARAYLHANCSHCHQPGGWTSPGVDMDLRWQGTRAQTRTCGVPVAFDIDPSAGVRIAPGDPEASSLWRRMQVEGVAERGQMPPVGRSIVDPMGSDVVRRWIAAMEGCPDAEE